MNNNNNNFNHKRFVNLSDFKNNSHLYDKNELFKEFKPYIHKILEEHNLVPNNSSTTTSSNIVSPSFNVDAEIGNLVNQNVNVLYQNVNPFPEHSGNDHVGNSGNLPPPPGIMDQVYDNASELFHYGFQIGQVGISSIGNLMGIPTGIDSNNEFNAIVEQQAMQFINIEEGNAGDVPNNDIDDLPFSEQGLTFKKKVLIVGAGITAGSIFCCIKLMFSGN